MNNHKIPIHFVCWERPEITELAIRTIARNTNSGNYRLVVLDNGSSREQQEMLTQLHENGLIDELHLLPENIGLEPARNRLLELAPEQYYLICADNDCLPPPIDKDGRDWIDKLFDLMAENPEYGAISCRTQVMIGTGNIFEGKEDEAVVEFPHPGGSLRIMRTDLVKRAGGWRDVGGRGAEERHICGKLHDLGYKTGFAVKVTTLHLFGIKDKTDRWGYSPEMKPEDSGHSDIWHPSLEQGDRREDVSWYAGDHLAERYFNGHTD